MPQSQFLTVFYIVLNVKNGVLCLKTLTLTPHNFNDQRFTYCIPVEYKPTADMSKWLQFLGQVVETNESQENQQIALHFFQLCAGYSITGHTNEEIALYLFGPLRSGKGTTMETLQALLPHPLSTTMEFATLSQKREPSSQNFDLAPLQPCRMVFASEGNRHHQLDGAKLKHMTGGDKITCAYKFKDQFSYKPQYTIWLASNWPIHLDPDDKAAWGRFVLVGYPTSYWGHENKRLKHAMERPANLEGVLRWLVEGAKEWYTLKDGLVIPDFMRYKLNKQHKELDYIGQWIEDCCEVDTTAFTKHEHLYISYVNWCKANGVEHRAKNQFSIGLESRGFTRDRQSVGGKQTRGFSDIRLTKEEIESNQHIKFSNVADTLVAELVDAEEVTIAPTNGKNNGFQRTKTQTH